MFAHRPNRSALRRTGIVTTLGALFGAGTLVALVGVGSPASALHRTNEPTMGLGVPMGDDWGPIDLDDLLADGEEEDLPNITIDAIEGPIVTIPIQPDDDDGPIFENPSLTIPIQPDDDDGPIYEGPIVTIPIQPDDSPTTTNPPVDPPVESNDLPTEVSETPVTADSDGPSEQPQEASNVGPFVHITSATVDCSGMVHLTYETGGSPAPAETTEHVVMFSPATDPAAVTAQRLAQRPTNGVFTVDLQSPVADGYRVFVVADFEPANPDGVALVDEADAAAPADCTADGSTG